MEYGDADVPSLAAEASSAIISKALSGAPSSGVDARPSGGSTDEDEDAPVSIAALRQQQAPSASAAAAPSSASIDLTRFAYKGSDAAVSSKPASGAVIDMLDDSMDGADADTAGRSRAGRQVSNAPCDAATLAKRLVKGANAASSGPSSSTASSSAAAPRLQSLRNNQLHASSSPIRIADDSAVGQHRASIDDSAVDIEGFSSDNSMRLRHTATKTLGKAKQQQQAKTSASSSNGIGKGVKVPAGVYGAISTRGVGAAAASSSSGWIDTKAKAKPATRGAAARAARAAEPSPRRPQRAAAAKAALRGFDVDDSFIAPSDEEPEADSDDSGEDDDDDSDGGARRVRGRASGKKPGASAKGKGKSVAAGRSKAAPKGRKKRPEDDSDEDYGEATKKARRKRNDSDSEEAEWDDGDSGDDDDDGGGDYEVTDDDDTDGNRRKPAEIEIGSQDEDAADNGGVGASSNAGIGNSRVLKMLKRGDQQKFIEVWTTAQKSQSKLKEDLHGGQLVTPAKLLAVTGWGVATAGGIAAAGAAGTGKSKAAAGAGAASSSSSSAAPVPVAENNLTEFQLIGLNWLLMLNRAQLNGVLADEMGLGKSIQAIALLAYLNKTEGKTGPYLIISPSATLSNWRREARRWAPQLDVRVYRPSEQSMPREEVQFNLRNGGPTADWDDPPLMKPEDDVSPTTTEGEDRIIDVDGSQTDDVEEAETNNDEEQSGENDDDAEEPEPESEEEFDEDEKVVASSDAKRSFDILVISYHVFDKTGPKAAQDRHFLKQYKWQYIICDEGHNLKNSDSQRFRQVGALHAERKLLLSGTPIQNTLKEWFSLLRFIQPKLFTTSVEQMFVEKSRGKAGKEKDAMLQSLKDIVAPFILRRFKQQVMKDLPPKSEDWVYVDMPPLHQAAYRTAIARLRAANGLQVTAPAAVTADAGRKPRAAAHKAIDGIAAARIAESQSINAFIKSASTAAASDVNGLKRKRDEPAAAAIRSASSASSAGGSKAASGAAAGLSASAPSTMMNYFKTKGSNASPTAPSTSESVSAASSSAVPTTTAAAAAKLTVLAAKSSYGTDRREVQAVDLTRDESVLDHSTSGNRDSAVPTGDVIEDSDVNVNDSNVANLTSRGVSTGYSNVHRHPVTGAATATAAVTALAVGQPSADVTSAEDASNAAQTAVLQDVSVMDTTDAAAVGQTVAAVKSGSSGGIIDICDDDDDGYVVSAEGGNAGAASESAAALAPLVVLSAARVKKRLAQSKKAGGGQSASQAVIALRMAAQHPLLSRYWFSNERMLSRIAEALWRQGTFGDPFDRGCTREKVYEILSSDTTVGGTDYVIWMRCIEAVLRCRGRIDGATSVADFFLRQMRKSEPGASSAAVSSSSATPHVPATKPLSLDESKKDMEFLTDACMSVPGWAFEQGAKMAHLKLWLPGQIAAGHRILIFSQFVDTLGLISHCLAAWGIKFLTLTGDATKSDERQGLMDLFTHDTSYSVFLITTKTGGTGLNLMAADTVVIHDCDWNPHNDAQAVDRAHRLGQTRPVRVFKLVTSGTTDVNMVDIAKSKLDLDRMLGGDRDASAAAPTKGKGRAAAKGINFAEVLAQALTGAT